MKKKLYVCQLEYETQEGKSRSMKSTPMPYREAQDFQRKQKLMGRKVVISKFEQSIFPNYPYRLR